MRSTQDPFILMQGYGSLADKCRISENTCLLERNSNYSTVKGFLITLLPRIGNLRFRPFSADTHFNFSWVGARKY